MTTILEALKEAESKATPGPWLSEPEGPWGPKQAYEGRLSAAGDEIGLLYCNDGCDEPSYFPGDANGHLIALSRTHLGKLIEAAEALQELQEEAALYRQRLAPHDAQMIGLEAAERAAAILSRLQEPCK